MEKQLHCLEVKHLVRRAHAQPVAGVERTTPPRALGRPTVPGMLPAPGWIEPSA